MMSMFDLPKNTLVKNVIPKNSFDDYTNAQLRRLLTDQVLRITWLHSLSHETINLKGKDIEEIQVFHIELKERVEIPQLLLMMNRAIPYHIVFVISYADEVYLSASMKHPHPTRENIDVVSDTATTDWMKREAMPYQFELMTSLDVVFYRFFLQIKDYKIEDGAHVRNEELERVIQLKKEIETLNKEIERVKKRVYNTKQANMQLEYYQELRGLEKELKIKEDKLKKKQIIIQ